MRLENLNNIKDTDLIFLVSTKKGGVKKYYKIDKIGNKYVVINDMQFVKSNAQAEDFYYSHFELYKSEEDYIKELNRQKVWKEFYEYMKYKNKSPNHVTTEDIREILNKMKGSKVNEKD